MEKKAQKRYPLEKVLTAVIEIHPTAVNFFRHPDGRVTVVDANDEPVVLNRSDVNIIYFLIRDIEEDFNERDR